MSDDIQNNGLVAIDPGAFRILTEAVIKVGRFVAGERRVSRHTTHGVFLSQPDRHDREITWRPQSRYRGTSLRYPHELERDISRLAEPLRQGRHQLFATSPYY